MTLEEMARENARMWAALQAAQKRNAELQADGALRQTQIEADAKRLAALNTENEALRREAEQLRIRAASLESQTLSSGKTWAAEGPDPIEARMDPPDGVSLDVARRRPRFAEAVGMRNEIARRESIPKEAAWQKLMQEQPHLRQALIDESTRAHEGR